MLTLANPAILGQPRRTQFLLEQQFSLSKHSHQSSSLSSDSIQPGLLGSLDFDSLPNTMSTNPSLNDTLSSSVEYNTNQYSSSAGQPQGLSQQQIQLQLPQQYQQQLQNQLACQQLIQHQLQLRQSLAAPPTAEEKPMTPLQLLRPHHPMVLQRTVSMPHIRSSFLQQQQHQHQQQGFVGYPSAQLPPQHQSSVQIQPEDHSMTSLPQYAPNSRPYHTPGAEQFVPFPEHIPDLASINHYASNFQSQCPVLANTTSELDQDFDLMISSLNLASPSIRDMDFSIFSQISNNSMSPSFQSPSPSWASGSPSRETSPSLSPNLNRRQPIPSPPSSIVLPSNVTSNSSPLENSTTASTSASLPPKPRRKRVRPPAPKKPKKVRPTSFACVVPGCDKVFSRAYNLTSHMKIHSSERPFHCGICPLAFSRRHDRDRHVRLHTGEKPYSCDICDAGFMRNDALLRHQKLCGVAGSAFINQDGQIWFAS